MLLRVCRPSPVVAVVVIDGCCCYCWLVREIAEIATARASRPSDRLEELKQFQCSGPWPTSWYVPGLIDARGDGGAGEGGAARVAGL